MKNFLILNIILSFLYVFNAFSNTYKNYYVDNAKEFIPVILSKQDLDFYKKALEFHSKAEWEKSQTFLDKVENKILLGYFEYEKLMHPNKYRASHQELADWFSKYTDYPPVLRKRVYYLLLKRLPKNKDKNSFKKPKFGNYLRGYGEDNRHNKNNLLKGPRNSIRNELKKTVNTHMNENNHAELIKKLKLKFPNELYAQILINKNINKIFFKGRLKDSQKLYDFYINSLQIKEPNFYFRAGINAYKLKNLNKAKKYFLKCQENIYYFDEWQIASCLYWHAMTEDSKNKQTNILKEATRYPRTFYGQLSLELLKLPDPFIWGKKEVEFDTKSLKGFKKNKVFRRAVALTELNLYNKADLEIRNFYSFIDQNELRNLFLATEELNLAAVLIRLGSKFSELDSTIYLRGLYPSPKWEIKNGYLLDKAFLFAVIRRESAFNFKAKSQKGARGLMQLMPRTASKLNNDYRLRYGNAHKLYSMELNLAIGQKFLIDLIDSPSTNNSLLETLIAYNAGIKRLKNWKNNINENNPIAFIESIPIKETRWFVKYILTDLWMYRDKFGQDKPTREFLSNKKWPIYKNIDFSNIRDASFR